MFSGKWHGRMISKEIRLPDPAGTVISDRCEAIITPSAITFETAQIPERKLSLIFQ
jgi:hypothetical protein